MKEITINGNKYILEFTFEAALQKNLIQRFFNIMSGTYFLKNADTSNDNSNINQVITMFEGVSDMASDIPQITKEAFYAGLLENHNVSEEEALSLMKAYMKDSKKSFKGLYDELQEIMRDDGFFEQSGLMEMLEKFNQTEDTNVTDIRSKKKQTSAK